MFFMSNIFFDDTQDENEFRKIRWYRRHLRDRSNPLDLPEEHFLQRYRVSKDVFAYLLRELKFEAGYKCTFIPPILQLAITLQLLGGGAYQFTCRRWIQFKFSGRTQEYFMANYNIPGVIGCIDGTHITFLRPPQDEYMFFNRKGKHSINAMVICNEKYEILAINAKYGGCAHDSFVWHQSREHDLLETQYDSGRRNFWLLGDSGYKLEPYVITPYRISPDNSPEAKFNEIHSKARSVVERCIGVWKTRWRIILEERKCRYLPSKVARLIYVTAALHNICCHFKVPLNERISVDTDGIDETIRFSNETSTATTNRDRIRDAL
ncbi:putative nuclease HARBI1 [Topomyia yanbarensis]|uniref:putative nuclease HARBI1 n=1 Tax=Topomyia yanbarensis TaxID=2498891 RepID=UPI00273B70F2|nr:putative nuclease HARBI1 [Topomyia yanbarensis]